MRERQGAPLVTGTSALGGAGEVRGGAAHPVLRYALLFGLLNGLFALLQVGFSTFAAIANHAAMISLAEGLQNGGFQLNTMVRWLAPAATAAYGTCLLGFVVSLWLCWHAGLAAAQVAGRRSVGAGAGLLTSALGSLVWITSSVVVVLALHTDATITGMLATTSSYSGANLAGELFGLLGQEIVAALLALGCGALAGRSGANHAMIVPAFAGQPAHASQLDAVRWPEQTYQPPLPAGYVPYPGYPVPPRGALPLGMYSPSAGYAPFSRGYPPMPGIAYPPPPEVYTVPVNPSGSAAPTAGGGDAEARPPTPETRARETTDQSPDGAATQGDSQ